MYVPCATCRERGGCTDEELTYREAVFHWLADMPFGCEDYREDSYHGVEGVLNVSRTGVVSSGDGVRGDYRRRGVCGFPLYLGAT